VTAILPRPHKQVFYDPVYASIFQLNGTGELTSSHIISETGILHSPVVIGGTTSLGAMIEGLARWGSDGPRKDDQGRSLPPFHLPCVAETSDTLSDQKAFPIKVDHVLEALNSSTEQQTPDQFEGSRGGGTGMMCQGFKGGNGTSSRLIPGQNGKQYTLGAFVWASSWAYRKGGRRAPRTDLLSLSALRQANFGTARDFVINGLPIGKSLIASSFHGEEKRKAELDHNNAEPWDSRKDGSIIVILATDMPLVPHQLSRLCRRVSFGLAHVGAIAHNMSGDLFLAFSTQSTVPPNPPTRDEKTKVGPLGLPAVGTETAKLVSEDSLNNIFYAVADVVEEAVLNALCAAKDEQGANGTSAKGLPHDQVQAILGKAKKALDGVFPGLY
jgi:D-aminopeptidase